MTSLFWLSCLLVLFLFMFALAFMQGSSDYLTGEGEVDDKEHFELLLQNFSTLPGAMLALFMSITGGFDWGDMSDALFSAGSAYGIIFIFFIMFMLFGVMNVIIGVFAESCAAQAQKDRHL